jgi:hypothetical protein
MGRASSVYDRAMVASAIERLLGSDEPAIRRLVEVDLLGRAPTITDDAVLAGALVSGLLAGQRRDGGFGHHPYSKWTGTHWRLVSLVELGVPRAEQRVQAALDAELAWLDSPDHLQWLRRIKGIIRSHASIAGNGLAVAARLGRADDPRARRLVDGLLEWQWPDGGWNCDRNAVPPLHSSVHESLPAAWGLHEYAAATGDEAAAAAADRAAEFFLAHRVYRSHRSDRLLASGVTTIHYPPYWHYDLLQALLVLARMGRATDPRAADAIGVLRAARAADGTWHATKHYWRAPGRSANPNEVIDWGVHAHEMATLNGLRVLAAAGQAELGAAG